MRKSFFIWCILSAVLVMLTATHGNWAQSFTLGLVSEDNPKLDADAAYKWAQGKFNAVIIPCPKTKTDLTKFGVVWWDESDGASIPQAFLGKGAVDAFLEYVKDGGGLLLSNLAFHYVYEMGLEPENPRYFGRNDNSPLDWTDIQITKGQENHPVFKGMTVEKGLIQYDIQGWTDGSDFYGANGPLGPKKDGILLAQTIDGRPQCNPLVEYRVGGGTIIIIGWVWSSWVVNKKLEDVHGQLHTNILNYLASKSKFAAIDGRGKLAATWGSIKK